MYHYSGAGSSSSSFSPAIPNLGPFSLSHTINESPPTYDSTSNPPLHPADQEGQEDYPEFPSFSHRYSHPFTYSEAQSGSSTSNTGSTYDNAYNIFRPSSPVNVPPLPSHIESAFSRHPAWSSLPQPAQSFDRSSVTVAGWEVDMDPSSVSNAGQSYGSYPSGPTVLPPRPVPLGSRYISEMGRVKGDDEVKGGWGEEFGQEMTRRRIEATRLHVERDMNLLQTYLTELIHLMSPFATTSEQPKPPVPPPYLHTRFTRLSNLIHTTLVSLGPQVHPLLHPAFDLSLPGGKSTAEKDMEIIRNRRDALIAKAKGAGERSIELGQEPVEEKLSLADKKMQGRCHGCGIGVTHKWRTGPDGPKSLCDSCGVHYAKLARSRTKEQEKDASEDEASPGSREGAYELTHDEGVHWVM